MISRIRQDSSVDPVRAGLRLAWLETTAYGAWFRLVGEPEAAIAVGAERIARTAPEAHALLLKGFGSASLDARVEAIEPFADAVVARARTLRPLEVHAHDFHPVIRLPSDYEVYDFTRGYDRSRALTSAYGIGRYDEGRVGMYETELFGGVRDVHMGIDIGAPVGEPVHAFHDGEVHMLGYNGAPGDYGYTLVTHHVLGGRDVWALHGHLSARSIEGRYPGQLVARGEVIAWVGDRRDNGGWNPHVHFQLSVVRPEVPDMPGAVSERDRAEARLTYPDPRVALGPLY